MNQPDENTTPQEYFFQLMSNPSEHIASHATLAMARAATELNKRIFGQVNIESNPESLNVLFCAYPSGEHYCWFVELGCFVLIALVDEKIKCLGIIHVTDVPKFQQLLNATANGLNLKNSYPIEEPGDFKPVQNAAGAENPPDAENAGE